MYDPFVPGPFTVAERSMQAFDATRNRSFPCDVWHPTEPVGISPIILLSHSNGGSGRRAYTFLTNHLASHGYIVAGLNHSELVAPEFAHREGETPEQRTARAGAFIAARVPDIRFPLDYLLTDEQLSVNAAHSQLRQDDREILRRADEEENGKGDRCPAPDVGRGRNQRSCGAKLEDG